MHTHVSDLIGRLCACVRACVRACACGFRADEACVVLCCVRVCSRLLCVSSELMERLCGLKTISVETEVRRFDKGTLNAATLLR